MKYSRHGLYPRKKLSYMKRVLVSLGRLYKSLRGYFRKVFIRLSKRTPTYKLRSELLAKIASTEEKMISREKMFKEEVQSIRDLLDIRESEYKEFSAERDKFRKCCHD